jgi:hypothetical protein
MLLGTTSPNIEAFEKRAAVTELGVNLTVLRTVDFPKTYGLAQCRLCPAQ